MQTHDDAQDHQELQQEFMKHLEQHAKKIVKEQRSQITAGYPGEKPLGSGDHRGMHVRHMPDDPHGIIRISCGGGDHLPIRCDYLTVRGDLGACMIQLQKAIQALGDFREQHAP